jgi:hypothetical protein
MKFCKDCKQLNDQTCMASGDFVTGEHLPARQARTDNTQCGPNARWFEPAKDDWREPRDADGYRTE